MQRSTVAGLVVIAGGALLCSGVAPAQEVSAPEAGTSAVQGPAPASVRVAQAEESGGSQVRIVRLSQVRGAVQMDRNTGRGYEAAFANIPVIAGAKLRTEQGVAEVEFEDNSSLRLVPGSEVAFSRLGRSATGATETSVDVIKGIVYVGLTKTKGNQFTLTDSGTRTVLMPGAHLRLDATGSQVQLAVFDGGAEVQVGSALTQLSKHQSVALTPASLTVATVQKGTDEADWDGWDRQENDFHKQKASFAGAGGVGSFGANDLSYYGSFVNMPGCGSMWRPYFATAAWDPFANGVWAYYPTAGYSWVSPYPWGWLPFHSGNWASCGAAGWGWRPGGSWYGLQNLQAMRIANHPLPHPVPTAPLRNASSFVPVNTRPLSASGMSQQDAFTFRRDSAGLGVPRSSFGSLHSISSNVERHGMVTAGVPEGSFVPAATNAHQGVPMGSHGGATTMGNVHAGMMPSASRNTGSLSPRASAPSGVGGMRGGSMSMPAGGGMHGGGAPSAASSPGGAGHK